MALSTQIKFALNRLLAPFNLRLDSLTEAHMEAQRIELLNERGLLEAALYEDIPGVEEAALVAMATCYEQFSMKIDRLVTGDNDVGFDPANNFFSTPDMQALYLMLQQHRPSRLLEVGSGNSTRIARQAIIDGALNTRITSIDPAPRVDIQQHADELVSTRLEDMPGEQYFSELSAGDILFIDSSHLVHVGNDVVRLFCRVLPALKAGVIVHVHDVFLPYEYPPVFSVNHPGWGEQYLLYTYLVHAQPEVLWPGYQLQKQRPELLSSLPFLAEGRAQSFWFRVSK